MSPREHRRLQSTENMHLQKPSKTYFVSFLGSEAIQDNLGVPKKAPKKYLAILFQKFCKDPKSNNNLHRF